MIYEILVIVYISILGFISALGFFRHSKWDTALKVFYALIFISFVTEILNYILDYYHISKNPVSHVFSIIELSLTTIYFLFTIWVKPGIWSIFMACFIAAALGVANIFIQTISSYNTVMLMAESLVISAMALYALYKISTDIDIRRIRTYPHFIIWTVLLISWTSTFFFWAFLSYLKEKKELYNLLLNIQIIVAIIIYSIFARAFYTADFSEKKEEVHA